MTEDHKAKTPGMAEVSAKFTPETVATLEWPDRGDDETQIAYTYRKLLTMRAGRPPYDSRHLLTRRDAASDWVVLTIRKCKLR